MKIKLTHMGDEGEGDSYEFSEHDTFVFGRAEDVHCQIKGDNQVSRYHFLLEVLPPAARIVDLGSTNGTFVNATRLHKATPECSREKYSADLKCGDIIKVGRTSLVFGVHHETSCVKSSLSDTSSVFISNSAVDEFVKNSFEHDGIPEIPDYKIKHLIGKGGMGAVYLANNRQTGDDVALKVISIGGSTSEWSRSSFQREITLTRQLKHPNIIEFIDSGFTQQMIYLAIEYFPEGNVIAHANRSKGILPLPTVLDLARQILDALAYAHSRGVVHRDIKPQNILLRNEPNSTTYTLADFGLAKSYELAGLSGLTATGHGGGSPMFMPKEQITNFRHVTPASDVFGLGATLYHLLCGKPIYDFSGSKDPIAAVLSGKIIPIEERMEEIPHEIAEVINKSLSPNISGRYVDGAEMLKAVEAILG